MLFRISPTSHMQHVNKILLIAGSPRSSQTQEELFLDYCSKVTIKETHFHEKEKMNANFSPHHSRSCCSLTLTPPTRRGSIEEEQMARVSSVPAKLLTSYKDSAPGSSHNAVFCNSLRVPVRGSLQREKRMSPSTNLKPAASMMFDYASRQRNAAAKSIVIPRANTFDRIPSMPVRQASPLKERQRSDINFSWDHSSKCLNHAVEEEQSAAIQKPKIKSNMFLQGMSIPSKSRSISSKQKRSGTNLPLSSKSKQRNTPTTHVNTLLHAQKSPQNILDAANLGASERNEKDLAASRWDSSPSLSFPVRSHKSLSSSLDFFLNTEEARMPQCNKVRSTSCLISRERLRRSEDREKHNNSSEHTSLEAMLLC